MKITTQLLAIAVAGSAILAAQNTASAPPVYTITTSYHVSDENRPAYEAWLKDKYRRMMEVMLKENSNVQALVVTRLIFGGIKEPETNFFTSTIYNGVPKLAPDLQNKIAQQLFGKSYADFQKEAQPLRRRMGQILSRRMMGTPMAAAEGDLLRIDYRKIVPGRTADYVQLEHDYIPLREAQVHAGKMKGWSMSTLVLPGGTEREFDAFTTHTVKDLDGLLSWNQGSSAMAAQLSPPVNVTGLALRGPEISKITRGETRSVVLVVKRP